MKIIATTSKQVSEKSDQDKKSQKLNRCDHNVLISIIFGSLTFACFWQFYCLSKTYNNSPTVISVESVIDTEYKTLPAMTFCTNVGNLATQGTTSQSVFEMMNVHNIVEYIRLKSDDGSPDRYLNHLMNRTIESITHRYYCFTINTQLKGYSAVIRKDQQIWIKLKSYGVTNSWWIYFHNSYEMPTGYEWNAIEVRKGYSTPISYTHEVHQKINRPESQCLDYIAYPGYTSHKECLRKCRISEINARCGAVSKGMAVHKDETAVRFAKSKAELECTNKWTQSGFDQCNHLCHFDDCRKDIYKPYKIGNNKNQFNYSLVEFIPTPYPEVRYIEKSRFDANVSLYYMAANLSILFGFVLYFLYNNLNKAVAIKPGLRIVRKIEHDSNH